MSMTTATRPGSDEYAPSYENYVSIVPDGDIVETLSHQLDEVLALLRGVPESRGDARYAPDKWSVKELVGHMCDTERVFAYRAMCIARGERADLPGMDQDEYMGGANFGACTLKDLADEFGHVRRATLSLFRHLDAAGWARRGTANANEVSVRALAHIIAGHASHHARILRERYL
jgi:hypothetical protein